MTFTPVVITEADALNGLRTAVAARGASYTYRAPDNGPTRWCVYAWTYTPGEYEPMCIVGHALSTLGVPLRLMYHCANDETVAGLADQLTNHGYVLTPDAVSVLAAAQHVQDHATVNVIPLFTAADPGVPVPVLWGGDGALPTCAASGCTGTVSDASWGAALRAAVDQARANADARRHHAEILETLRRQAESLETLRQQAEIDTELAARELVREMEWLLINSAETGLPLASAA